MTIYHKHHIVPKHMGGTDDPSNLVELTVEEHAEAHRKLYEQYGLWQDKVAWKGLSGMIGKEEIMREISRQNGKINGKRNAGRKHSEESRKKMSASHTGKMMSEESIKKMSEAKAGRKLSEEHKKKLAAAQTGKRHSEETRKKMSGRKLSEETRKKMSEAKAGRKLSEEHKKKLADQFAQEWIVIDPQGNEYQICNLKRFCKEHNLNAGRMYTIAKGKESHHKGWSCSLRGA
jgi:hypothetical protein